MLGEGNFLSLLVDAEALGVPPSPGTNPLIIPSREPSPGILPMTGKLPSPCSSPPEV